MEVAFNKLFQFFWTIFYFFTQVAVVKVAQLFDNTINKLRTLCVDVLGSRPMPHSCRAIVLGG